MRQGEKPELSVNVNDETDDQTTIDVSSKTTTLLCETGEQTEEQERATPDEVIEVSVERFNGEWFEESTYPDGRRVRRRRTLPRTKVNVKVPVVWISIVLLLLFTLAFRPELVKVVGNVIATIRPRAG